jgi:hypothetical protein
LPFGFNPVGQKLHRVPGVFGPERLHARPGGIGTAQSREGLDLPWRSVGHCPRLTFR